MAHNVTRKAHIVLNEDFAALPASVWDLSLGQHPTLATALAPHLAAIAGKIRQVAPDLSLPYALAGHGHHAAHNPGPRAASLTYLDGQADRWPLAPLVVRDLAGRLIHTGLNPIPAGLPAHHFPADATPLSADHPLNTQPDEDFMVLFRLLEWSPYTGTPLTGQSTLHVRALYPNLQDYPYKIRVDSFYQDGFRPPQTPRLFVHRPGGAAKEGQDAATAALAAEEFQSRWQKRPAGQGYEAFYEANDGATWFENLFTRGCTIIPTLEAFNGLFKVTDDFGILDVWPGRAVAGLHTVMEDRDSDAPKGTILEVHAPGYLTGNQCVPAQVVVSNGKRYRSPHTGNPAPQYPNLTLPHPRLAPVWGAAWLPTHPLHFEAPALWNWSPSGAFQQQSGPVWDPVHYVYASTARILKAYRAPYVHAPHRAAVPEDMRPRFHPVISPTWYDTVSDLTHQFRQTHPDPTPWQTSRLDAVPRGKPTSNLGYHPLPSGYEYELMPEALPERDPRQQQLAECPGHIQARLLDPITSAITVEEAQKALVLLGENPRQEVLAESWWRAAPHSELDRYAVDETCDPTPDELALVTCYWADVPASQLAVNPKRLFNQAINNALGAINSGLANATLHWQEHALATRRRWHRVVRKYPGWYAHAWLFNQAHAPENTWQNRPDYLQPQAGEALQNQRGAVMRVAKPVAPKRAARLPARRRSGKVSGT